MAECSSDTFGPADNMFGSHYTSCIANEVFGCILCFSKFGKAILETSRTPPQTRDDDLIATDPDAWFWQNAQAASTRSGRSQIATVLLEVVRTSRSQYGHPPHLSRRDRKSLARLWRCGGNHGSKKSWNSVA